MSNHTCKTIKDQLLAYISPGSFTEFPGPIRLHLDECKSCAFYLERLIIEEQRLQAAAAVDGDAAVTPPEASSTVRLNDLSFNKSASETDTVKTLVDEPHHSKKGAGIMPGPDSEKGAYHVSVPKNSTAAKSEPPQPSERPIKLVLMTKPSKKKGVFAKAAIVVVLVVGAAAAALLVLKPWQPEEVEPRHAKLARLAGQAFEERNWEETIRHASDCTDEFLPAAVLMQKELEKVGHTLPEGKVTDKAVRDEILSHGPLNDVGTCFYYMGEALRQLAKKQTGEARKAKLEEARKAYESAAALTHARCWDPKGNLFWSPAALAAFRLKELDEELKYVGSP